ncbi:ABC transporter ATP-binding protein [Corynebacterium urealyticum]|uniref:ABC transporter ATP-binding protein n=1 Tax=Corynebacterium urealyticum TaxID=43771 RepID=UPI0019105C3B|nr:ABC transporter ATP-binding protein [Corynebacterium urealyticum]QQE50695.1 ABC transporter ATP-binding protein [Corynebacterium urealyticum]
MITVEQLSKSYGKNNVLKDISFHVPDGQVTGFLGPNGAGKSTTMRCMLGLDRPTAGHVTFSGEYRDGQSYDGAFATLKNKSQVAGAVLDASWFTPARTGRNHLRVLAHGAGISDKRVDECLEIVGLSSAAKKKAGGYSLGMKQRLGLAAALLGDPQHLIMDEPVNGLDPEGVTWMRNTIRALAAEGRSVLVSSHLLSEMQLTADRLVVIGKGQMIGEYSLDEFLAGGTVVTAECREAVLLSEKLQHKGLKVELQRPRSMRIVLPEGLSEEELRELVAKTAMEENFLITKLAAETANLEQRFLAATSEAQEYRTGAVADAGARRQATGA